MFSAYHFLAYIFFGINIFGPLWFVFGIQFSGYCIFGFIFWLISGCVPDVWRFVLLACYSFKPVRGDFGLCPWTDFDNLFSAHVLCIGVTPVQCSFGLILPLCIAQIHACFRFHFGIIFVGMNGRKFPNMRPSSTFGLIRDPKWGPGSLLFYKYRVETDSSLYMCKGRICIFGLNTERNVILGISNGLAMCLTFKHRGQHGGAHDEAEVHDRDMLYACDRITPLGMSAWINRRLNTDNVIALTDTPRPLI